MKQELALHVVRVVGLVMAVGMLGGTGCKAPETGVTGGGAPAAIVEPKAWDQAAVEATTEALWKEVFRASSLSLYETRLRRGYGVWNQGNLPYYDASGSTYLLQNEVEFYRIALKKHRAAARTRLNYERMLVRQREINRDLATCHFSKSLEARFERINALVAELGGYYATVETGGK